MHAVILAAGDGGRLHPLTSAMPKPLLMLRGRPIINHVLDSLFAAGVDAATIVVGYRGDQMRAALDNLRPCGMTLTFVENDAWQLGNARSLWTAREAVATLPGFVLSMADHVVEPALVRALTAVPLRTRCALAIEYADAGDPRADEATRALARGGRIVELGKGIGDWNALDTGVFWCTPRVFDAMTPDLRDGECGAVFASLAHSGDLDAVDVSGRCWIDIDTEEDLRRARSLLGADASGSGMRAPGDELARLA